ncbi:MULTISPECIES: sigma-54-dependent transcriptional regulator [Desulfotignum]|jgi:two-component system response regulator AtoC|uniref:Acetoacetate metabolism regulatory protein AtoC n=1 Tax=Desulfotignum phosphitoxidans DSM 13687 TaxID=1286635 RepID=S0G483_9BACT|nr:MULTISPECIES: sigma-54 dependent transcriptional regulator [Desulfotignum]EMS79122.1 acetoacetate metabolism regulatory protein AtoC [Desulfotignum phosphitoxidans DSM 13687]
MANRIIKILLVDDEERLLDSMARRLALLGFETIKASSGTRAIEVASKTRIDLAIVDLKMPDMDGLTTITRLKQITPDLKTVLLTGYGSEETRQKTKISGSEYFEKDSMSDLWDLIKGFSAKSTKQLPSKELIDPAGRRSGDLPKIIGETPGMQRLRKDIERLSEMDCTIMIRGEQGTGKELAARVIHRSSHRKDQRFLAFNCGCFSDDFNFTELLGSLEGSGWYPGSVGEKSKNLRYIGTIFLDHFETMPEQTQQDMLTLLEDTLSTQSQDSAESLRDIRFIIATHQDLKQRVENNKFNKNLYQRLNAISINIPPLRERRDDIFPLCRYFLAQLNKEFKKNVESFSEEVLSIFMAYPFPGNVRELRHIIERAVILTDTASIEMVHLPDRFKKKNQTVPAKIEGPFETLSELEKKHILKAVELTRGNRSKAAEILGISRAALWRKLKIFTAEN